MSFQPVIRSRLLLVDALINLVLGLLLLVFPPKVVQFLGVPVVENSFYPSILGGVLIGIAVALFIESVRSADRITGLGLGGAIAINLIAAFVLIGWLISGRLAISIRGQVVLWALVLILFAISITESLAQLGKKASDSGLQESQTRQGK